MSTKPPPPMGKNFGYVFGAPSNPRVSVLQSDLVDAMTRFAAAKERLETVQQELKTIQQGCQHKWSDPVPHSHYSPGYSVPGDPEGTMGVDRRGPTYVESSTEVWYERRCDKCGLVERTDRTEPTGQVKPKFSDQRW